MGGTLPTTSTCLVFQESSPSTIGTRPNAKFSWFEIKLRTNITGWEPPLVDSGRKGQQLNCFLQFIRRKLQNTEIRALQ